MFKSRGAKVMIEINKFIVDGRADIDTDEFTDSVGTVYGVFINDDVEGYSLSYKQDNIPDQDSPSTLVFMCSQFSSQKNIVLLENLVAHLKRIERLKGVAPADIEESLRIEGLLSTNPHYEDDSEEYDDDGTDLGGYTL